jgi:hypothetical protein
MFFNSDYKERESDKLDYLNEPYRHYKLNIKKQVFMMIKREREYNNRYRSVCVCIIKNFNVKID